MPLGAARGAGGRELAVAALLLEAARAVHRLVAPRLERHARDAAALAAHRLEHLAGAARGAAAATAVAATAALVAAVVVVAHSAAAAALALACRAALGAAPRLVREALLGKEFLF